MHSVRGQVLLLIVALVAAEFEILPQEVSTEELKRYVYDGPTDCPVEDMTMEGVAYVEGGGSVSGSQLWVAGDLRLRQLVQELLYLQGLARDSFSERQPCTCTTSCGPPMVRCLKE